MRLVSPALAQILRLPFQSTISIGRDVAIHFRFALGSRYRPLHRNSFVPLLQFWAASSPPLPSAASPPLPPRMRAARMQPDKATATISVFPRLFSPSFRAISPFSTATCSTIQGNERKWRMLVACSSRGNEPLSQMTASAEYRHLERR